MQLSEALGQKQDWCDTWEQPEPTTHVHAEPCAGLLTSARLQILAARDRKTANGHCITLLTYKAQARTFQSKKNTDVILEVSFSTSFHFDWTVFGCFWLKHVLLSCCTNVHISYIHCKIQGLNVCHHITDSTGFLHQALWLCCRRLFWITPAVDVSFIFILSTKQPRHSSVYSLRNGSDNKCLHGETSSFALLKCRNDCKYTPNSLSTESCLPRELLTARPLPLV